MVQHRWVPVLLSLAFRLLAVTELRADAPRQADVRVSTTVVSARPERFGLNLQSAPLNNFTADPSFEPTVLRHGFIASGGGTDYIENNAGPTTSYFQTITNGFFNGAAVRVYRFPPAGGTQLVRTGIVADYDVARHRVHLDSPGPAVAAGDHYFLEMVAANPPRDRVDPRLTLAAGNDPWRPVGGAAWPYGLAVTVVRDTNTVAPVGGGRSSARLTAPGAHEVTLRQARFSSPARYGGFYPQLIEGRRYRLEAWMRQEGIPSAHARLFLTQHYGAVSNQFAVTGDWTRHSFTFMAPPTPAGTEAISEICVGFTGPGTLWIDNVFLYEDDDLDPATSPALSPRAEAVAALTDFRPGAVRLWAGQANGVWGTSLDSLTSPEYLALNGWNADQGKVPPENAYTLPTALPLLEQLGATPWIIVSPAFNEAEWAGLIEYLAAPYDPAIDSAATKPWAARRHAQGRTRPWADSFERIRFEFGNEGWNYLFQFALPNPDIAGRLAQHFFEAAQASPWFGAMAGKCDFIVNGWILAPGPDGYGHAAARSAPSSRYSDVTAYLGGWEIGSNFGSNIVDTAFQDLLLFPAGWLRYWIDRQVDTRDAVRAAGRDYRLAVYEGGPGYPLPGPGREFDPVAEAYGKSMASGTATLDAFLYNSLRGIDPQAFFAFNAGANWTSHTNAGTVWRPHPAWLALEMRNRLGGGDLVNVTLHDAPVRTVPANSTGGNATPEFPSLPTLACHAFREGSRYTVFALSRELDQPINITLRLPFVQAGRVTRYQLTGDPRANNITGTNLAVTESAADVPLPVMEFTLPPASVVAYVFEDVVEPPASAPQPVISRAIGQASATTDATIRFQVHFSEPVSGFTAADIRGTDAAANARLSLTEVFPRLGTDFLVTVEGVEQVGNVGIEFNPGAAQNAAGMPSAAPEHIADAVSYAAPPVENRLLAHDDFDLGPTAAPHPPLLQDVATGTGWSQPWTVQNYSPDYRIGYRIAETSPLGFGRLSTRGNYASGGRLYETASRALDVPGALAGFDVPGSNPPMVGRAGRTLWFSVLLRKDSARLSDDGPWVNFVTDTYAWNFGAARLSIGSFGAAALHNGVPSWSIAVLRPDGTAPVVLPSSTPVVRGQAVLLVARLRFGVPSSVELFVNPPILGGRAPEHPDIRWESETTNQAIAFRTLGFYAGPSTSPATPDASLDELRLGDSYAAVTPVTAPTFQEWVAGRAWPGAAAAAAEADPDGDQASNLEEYARGTDPLAADASTTLRAAGTRSGPRVEWDVDPDTRNVVCDLETSTDLSQWNVAASYRPESGSFRREAGTVPGPGTMTALGTRWTLSEAVPPAGDSAGRFLRLRYRLP